MSNTKNLTGKKAHTAVHHVAESLRDSGIADAGTLAKLAVTRLVEAGIVEGDFLNLSPVSTEQTVFVKKLTETAVVPQFAHLTDAGADLISNEAATIAPGERALVGTGIAIEIPHGFVGLVHPRSGLAAKSGITVLNTPGTIDSGYRGELKVILFNTSNEPYDVKQGDRIAQLVIQRHAFPSFVESETLNEADRGESGFGSTGRN